MESWETVEDSNRSERVGILQLLRGILEDGRTLLSQQLLAAKLEIKEEIAKTRQASILLAAGGFVAALGILMLSLMIVFLLDQYSVLPLWASLGIVGLVYLVMGGILLILGKRKVSQVEAFPKESVEGAKEDVRYIKEKALSR